MAAVDEKVKQIIVEQLGVDEGEVTSSASFVDDLGADSLDTVEIGHGFRRRFRYRNSRRGRGKDPHRAGRHRLHREAFERRQVVWDAGS